MMDTLRGPEKEYGMIRLWVFPIAVMTTLVVSSYFSGTLAGPKVVGFDKVAHFCVFGLLGTLTFRALRIGFLDRNRWLLAFSAAAAYGVADEVLQYFNPSRSFDPMDWLADCCGSALAIALYRNWAWYRGLLETRLFRRKES